MISLAQGGEAVEITQLQADPIQIDVELGAIDITAVSPPPVSIEIGTIPGTIGPPGTSDLTALIPFEHVQAVSAQQWIVNHNLGRKPAAVQVLSPGFVEILADIVHTSDNQLQVLFNEPYTGSVRVI